MPLNEQDLLLFSSLMKPDVRVAQRFDLDLLRISYERRAQDFSLNQKIELLLEAYKYKHGDNKIIQSFLLNDIWNEYIAGLALGRVFSDSEKKIFQWVEKQITDNGVRVPRSEDSAAQVKRLGHIMGLTGEVGVKLGDFMRTQFMPSELNYDQISLGFVNEKLNLYTTKDHPEWKPIYDMFQWSATNLGMILQNPQFYTTNVFDLQKQAYEQNLPVHINSGWQGHSISIVLYKGYMVVSNRGEGGDQRFGTKIFKLKDGRPNLNDFQGLQNTFLSRNTKKDYILHLIEDLHRDPQPILSFPQKGQKHGTCSYVNKIASTEGLLCLLTLEQKVNLRDDKAIEAIRNYDVKNRQRYQDFTKFCRDSEVDRLEKDIKQAQATGDTGQLSLLVNMAVNIALQHHGQGRRLQKRIDENLRARKLLQLVEPHQDKLTTANRQAFPKLKVDVLSFVHQQIDAQPKPIPEPAPVRQENFEEFKQRLLKLAFDHFMPKDIRQAFKCPVEYYDLKQAIERATNGDQINSAYSKFKLINPTGIPRFQEELNKGTPDHRPHPVTSAYHRHTDQTNHQFANEIPDVLNKVSKPK